MSEDDQQLRVRDYAFVPAKSIGDADLVTFAAAAWPERPPYERVLASWWRRADPSCAVAAVHEATGTMAALCAARPAAWIIARRAATGRAICEWYVAPAHAGKGIGKRLVQHFAAPDRFLYAFAMSEAAAVNFAKLGWKGPYSATLLALPFPRLAAIPLALKGRGGVALEDYPVAAEPDIRALGADLDRIEANRDTVLARMRRGADEWSWRLQVCGERQYHVCLARRRDGAPVGYVVVRRMTPGSSRILGKREGAIIADLVAVDDDPAVLRALVRRAVEVAARLRVVVLLMATNVAAHRRALVATGFLSSGLPLLGRVLGRAAPIFMWAPDGPGAPLQAGDLALTFADSDVDLNL